MRCGVRWLYTSMRQYPSASPHLPLSLPVALPSPPPLLYTYATESAIEDINSLLTAVRSLLATSYDGYKDLSHIHATLTRTPARRITSITSIAATQCLDAAHAVSLLYGAHAKSRATAQREPDKHTVSAGCTAFAYY